MPCPQVQQLCGIPLLFTVNLICLTFPSYISRYIPQSEIIPLHKRLLQPCLLFNEALKTPTMLIMFSLIISICQQ